MRTTDDLLSHVRVSIDEDETSDISNAAILQALNRSQLRLQRVAAKRWPDLFRAELEVSGVSGRTTPVPAAAYGWIVNSVDVQLGANLWESLTPVKLSQIIQEDTNASAAQPQYWAQQGRELHLFPRASGSTLRIRYQRRLPELVVSQGLIDSVTEGGTGTDTRLYLNTVGDDLSTSTTSFAAFVNVIDPLSGAVLGTYQTTAVGGTYIDVGTPTRSTAYGQAVIDGQQTQAEIEAAAYEYPAQDDYVCSAAGSCVPPLAQDVADYLIHSAVVELKRKVGEDITQERDRLQQIEQDLDTLWAGRPGTKRVQRRNPYWGGTRTSLQSKYRG
jgi:hypothetical protein